MIILDWNKNSEEVLAQGHYNTKRSVNTEQTRLCQYWQERGIDKDEAFKIWVSLESPQVIGSLNEEERWEYFNYFWVRAKHYGVNKPYKYGLTKKEYDYINGLDIDLEYKNMLKVLAEYCASYGRENFFTCLKSEWRGMLRGQRQKLTDLVWATIGEINRRYNLFSYESFIQNKKEKVAVTLYYFDVENTERAQYMFTTDNKTCVKCGIRFYASSKSKTDLCPECYRHDLNLRKNKINDNN